jgi:hypothetical protein
VNRDLDGHHEIAAVGLLPALDDAVLPEAARVVVQDLLRAVPGHVGDLLPVLPARFQQALGDGLVQVGDDVTQRARAAGRRGVGLRRFHVRGAGGLGGVSYFGAGVLRFHSEPRRMGEKIGITFSNTAGVTPLCRDRCLYC